MCTLCINALCHACTVEMRHWCNSADTRVTELCSVPDMLLLLLLLLCCLAQKLTSKENERRSVEQKLRENQKLIMDISQSLDYRRVRAQEQQLRRQVEEARAAAGQVGGPGGQGAEGGGGAGEKEQIGGGTRQRQQQDRFGGGGWYGLGKCAFPFPPSPFLYQLTLFQWNLSAFLRSRLWNGHQAPSEVAYTST